MFYLFVSNSIVTTITTFIYERNRGGPVKMVTPKIHGAVTSLAFCSAFLAMNPQYMLMGNRAFPFFIIPAVYYMYELYEF